MVRRWLRAATGRLGIYLPFNGVICVDGVQTMAIDEQWRARITARRTLVFLEQPEPGDLRDVYGLGSGQTVSSVIYSSRDAVELAREQQASGAVTLYWWPRDPVPLFTLYEHESGWVPTATFDGSAISFEFRCDMRTGAFVVECTAPLPFEAAVVFRRPRWPRRLTERTVVEHALRHLHLAPAPRVLDDGRRIACDIREPHVGSRYVFVAFRRHGIADCERWLEKTSTLAWARRLAGDWARALGG